MANCEDFPNTNCVNWFAHYTACNVCFSKGNKKVCSLLVGGGWFRGADWYRLLPGSHWAGETSGWHRSPLTQHSVSGILSEQCIYKRVLLKRWMPIWVMQSVVKRWNPKTPEEVSLLVRCPSLVASGENGVLISSLEECPRFRGIV